MFALYQYPKAATYHEERVTLMRSEEAANDEAPPPPILAVLGIWVDKHGSIKYLATECNGNYGTDPRWYDANVLKLYIGPELKIKKL